MAGGGRTEETMLYVHLRYVIQPHHPHLCHLVFTVPLDRPYEPRPDLNRPPAAFLFTCDSHTLLVAPIPQLCQGL